MPAARVKMKIESAVIASLAAKLAQVDRKAARKAIKASVNEVTQKVMWDAKDKVPRRTGLLKKSIGRKVKSYRGGAVIVGIIGPRKGFRTVLNGVPIDPRKYAHLVEYGRREVVPKKKKVLAGTGAPLTGKGAKNAGSGPWQKIIYGKKVRSVDPHPFLQPAWDDNARWATDVFVRNLRAALKEFFSRARSGRKR